MKVPLLNQMSSVPAIDRDGIAWAQTLIDGLQKVRISELNLGFAGMILTWPGGSATSNTLQVSHGLSGQPTAKGAVFTQVNSLSLVGLNFVPVIGVQAGATSQQFAVAAQTIDGQLPANTATVQFYWVAML